MRGGSLVTGLALGASLFLWSCAQSEQRTVPLPERGVVLWSADQETGDLSQWTASNGGGAFNTASGHVTAVRSDIARSGNYVLALEIDNDDGLAHGARLFRYSGIPKQGFYSAYLYFDRPHPDADWWNVMQFKSVDENDESQPMWIVNVGTSALGEMRLYLWDAIDGRSHPSRTARENLTIPLGQWVHVELYLDRSTAPDGRIALWQDGVLLYDLPAETTAVSDELHWSLNNYTDTRTHGILTILADDAEIREAIPVEAE